MRTAHVYWNRQFAGTLVEQERHHYIFQYDDRWFLDISKPSIALSLPKTQQTYHSAYLFPFFYNLLSEGANRKLQCRQLKIDENDSFGLLLQTAMDDTIGAVTVRKAEDQATPSI